MDRKTAYCIHAVPLARSCSECYLEEIAELKAEVTRLEAKVQEAHDNGHDWCEGCNEFCIKPHYDSEGVPLCDLCWEELIESAKGE